MPTVEQRVTFSIGIAVLPDHAIDAGSLAQAADRALYAAKKAGRDRTETFSTDLQNTSSGAEVEPRNVSGLLVGDAHTNP